MKGVLGDCGFNLGEIFDVTNPSFAASVEGASAVGTNFRPMLERVVELLWSGKANREIADTLQIQSSTLRAYFTRIVERAGTSSRVQFVLHIVALAHQLGVWPAHFDNTTSDVLKNGKAANKGTSTSVIK